jgi:hypothetical protein
MRIIFQYQSQGKQNSHTFGGVRKMCDCLGNVYFVCLFDSLFGIKSSKKIFCDVYHTSGKFTIMIFPYDGKGRIFTF